MALNTAVDAAKPPMWQERQETRLRVNEFPIYLDYNASSPVAPQVLTAMLPYFARLYANASSSHAFGQDAHNALAEARLQVARLLDAEPGEIIFTGGGSEANNLAIKGVVMRHAFGQSHIITSVVDHPSVLKTCYYLAQRFGARVTLVPVDRQGQVNPLDIVKALTPKTRLVSIMLANNEVGAIQPIGEISRRVRECLEGVIIHTDAAQAAGKIPVNVHDLGVDLLTLAAHKFCGPKGVGALFVKRGIELDAHVHGAGHEGGLRSGTENIPGIVGMGMAAQLTRELSVKEEARIRGLRNRLQNGLVRKHPWAVVNGSLSDRLPNTLNISFPGLVGSDILAAAPSIAASTGAACHSGSAEPSSILMSMGIAADVARGALRLSIGRFTGQGQIERAIVEIARGVERVDARTE